MDEKVVLIFDKNQIYGMGLHHILQSQKSIKVIWEKQYTLFALKLIEKYNPKIIIMNLYNPDDNTDLNILKTISATYPCMKLIVITENIKMVTKIIRIGAQGFFFREMKKESFLNAFQIVKNGETYIHPKAMDEFIKDFKKIIHYQERRKFITHTGIYLSKREKEIVKLIVAGHSNRQIGEILLVSDKTINNHISNILKKTALKDRTQIAVFAIKNNWVSIKNMNCHAYALR